MANYTINNLPNTVTELNSADTLAVWDSANSKTAKINGSNLSNSILSNLVTISASSTTVSGLPIKRGSCVKILFTSAITGSDTSTAMAITYNGTSIPVKVGKQGSLSNFVAHEINSAYYYLQAYTTLELIYDGTQFIIVGNPVVLSSSDYTIYADGSKVVDTVADGNMNPVTSNAVYDALGNLIVTEDVIGTGITVGTNPTVWRLIATKTGYKPISYTVKGNNSADIIWGIENDLFADGTFSCDGYAKSAVFSGTLIPAARVTWMKILE